MVNGTKYILHGGYTRRDNEQNRSFYEELIREVPDGGTVLLVYFASTYDDISTTFNEQCEKIAALTPKSIHFIQATEKGFLDQLARADAVYFHGGTTPKLLSALRNYPDLEHLFEGKTIAGSSAGAYALATYGVAHSEDGVREGLGILPIRVICHYESPDLPPSSTSVEKLMAMAPEFELVLLKDCEWKVVSG